MRDILLIKVESRTFIAASCKVRIHLAASSELLAPNYKKIRNVNHESIKWNFLP